MDDVEWCERAARGERDDTEDEDEDAPPLDMAMMEMLSGARMVGMRNAPQLRKALPPAEDES